MIMNMQRTFFLIIVFVLQFTFVNAQSVPASPAEQRIESVDKFNLQPSTIDHLEYENIGPTIFSGRVSDVAVDPQDPTHFYVAYASGGLWETKNNGTTFTPIFDNEAVMTIGDIAVNWTANEIWVGTGEVNSSRSSYAGLGVYKSSNNGASWTHLGLPESHHIGRIILDESNPDNAMVAVLGHLYSDNPERGVYKTSDGGTTWKHTLAVNELSGAVDLLRDPNSPTTYYAAMWERKRYAWNFIESGPGSGIYKSIDNGDTWSKVNGGVSGFPDGSGTGRIGLSASTDVDGSTVLYALLDNYNRRPPEEKDEEEGLVKNDFKSMTKEAFLQLDEKDVATYLKSNRFPEKYPADKVIKMIADGEILPIDLATYLESANALLFDTPVKGGELYKSKDNGRTWQKTHEDFLDGLYYSYGYYFGLVTANPVNADQVYVGGVPILRSDDGGKTFSNISGANVHSDHHSIWVNPKNTRHIINGNDGGINISYDSGESWIKCNSPSVGQFYYINVDQAKPYNVYGGLQDNGVWKGSHQYRKGVRWHNTGQYPYQSIMGGDGMQMQIDPRDNNTVYTGFQFGNYFRVNVADNKREYITPSHELGEAPHRWNWQTPVHLSVHQPYILYMGAHKVFRSMNQGDDFMAISEDLTKGGKKGDVPFGTLSTIHESPLQFGLLYVGSDDGLIHVTRNGGFDWQNITSTLPQDLWVSRVQASAHQKSRVYAALNGYRFDHFDAYIYVSEDYGNNWTRLGLDLPSEPVNVIKEDPHHENIVYVGTDKGVYISLDRGKTFMSTTADIPNVPVHDIVIQDQAKDLLIGTHGRSIYRADLEALYQLQQAEDPELLVMDISSVRFNKNWGNRRNAYSKYAEVKHKIVVYSDNARSGVLSVKKEGLDEVLFSKTVKLDQGLNNLTYDLSLDESVVKKYIDSFKKEPKLKAAQNDKMYLLPGMYEVHMKADKHASSTTFEIKK